jgi:homoserine kinase
MKRWVKTFKNVQILVPASISNLGCGFDTLGLAVSLYFKTSIHSAPKFHFDLKVRGKPVKLSEEDNLFLKVLRHCYPVCPDDWRFNISIESEIPLRRGLGSSACAIISAVLTAARLLNLKHENGQLLHTAMQWEAHPDNLCASIFGGFTVAMQDDEKKVLHQKLSFPRSLRILMLIPECEVSTAEARQILPLQYPKEAVIANLQRLAFFMGCLQDGNFQGLRESVADQIHQPYRASLIPFARDLLDAKNFSSDSATVMSGSGPSFAVFYRVHEKKIRSVIQQIMASHNVAYELRNLQVDDEGARIELMED